MRLLKFLLIFLFLPLLAEEERESSLTEIRLISEIPKNQEDKEKEGYQSPVVDIHKTTESYETAFIKTIAVLIGLLLLIILTVWMFRKMSHGRFRGMNVLKSIKILEKRPLSPKSMLYLIEVGGKQILITESQLEVRNIATLDWIGNDKDL